MSDLEAEWVEIPRGPRKHRKGLTSRMHRPVYGGSIAEPSPLGWPTEFAYVECQRCGVAFGADYRHEEPAWTYEIAEEEAAQHNRARHPILRPLPTDSGAVNS